MLKPGYKQTDLGVLPEEWEVSFLSEVLKETRLGGNYANSIAPSPYPLIKMGNMGRGSINLNKLEFIKSRVPIENKHKLKYGALLFNTRNTLDLVGKVAIWKKELTTAYYNSNILQLIFDEKQVPSTFFVNYVMNTEQSIAQMRGLATGTTSVAAVYTRDLLEFQIPVPPPTEQQAIAEALGTIDTLLVSQQQLLAKKRALKLATQQALLSGERRLPEFIDNQKATVFAQTELGFLPEDWHIKTLGPFVKITSGMSPSSFHLENNGKPYFKVEQLNSEGNYIDHTPYFINSNYGVAAGSIIFPKRGASILLNKIKLLRCESFMDTNLMALTVYPDLGLDYLFLFHWLTFYNLSQVADTTSIPQINNKHIIPLLIPVPNILEQRAIAGVLSDMDAEIEGLAAQVAKTQALKQGMMQDLLTGTIRLRAGAAAPSSSSTV